MNLLLVPSNTQSPKKLYTKFPTLPKDENYKDAGEGNSAGSVKEEGGEAEVFDGNAAERDG